MDGRIRCSSFTLERKEHLKRTPGKQNMIMVSMANEIAMHASEQIIKILAVIVVPFRIPMNHSL
jgi:hypothetical protein